MLQTTIDEQMLTDAQLLAQIVQGENWALSEIYTRYTGLVFSVAFKILNDQASAEEVVQQVFTKVWRRAQLYQLERGKFSAWVCAITRNQCMDEFRHRRVQPVSELVDWKSMDWLPNNDDPAQDARDILDQARIRTALQQIPSEERIVIELAFWGEMTHREIAQYCHSPLGTVKTRVRTGMRRLKLLLQESV